MPCSRLIRTLPRVLVLVAIGFLALANGPGVAQDVNVETGEVGGLLVGAPVAQADLASSGSAQEETMTTISGADGDRASAVGGCLTCNQIVWRRGAFHNAPRQGAPFAGWGPGAGTHKEIWEGLCLYSHGVCIQVGLDKDPRELTEDVAQLVAQGDIDGLAKIVRTIPVTVSRGRSAIQVVGCDGDTIVGHVPVTLELLESLPIAEADIRQ